MAKVWIPSLMRDLTNGKTVVTVKGSTVRQVIDNLEAAYPGARSRLLSGTSLKPGAPVILTISDGPAAPTTQNASASPAPTLTAIATASPSAGYPN